MSALLRNILAVVAGIMLGTVVNMALIGLGPVLIPLPAGADTSTMEGLQAAMADFEPRHFVFPFLAHALGTFSGALVAAAIAGSHKQIFAMVIACFFLFGGIYMVAQLPSPLWFALVDLGLAYFPMGYLAGRLGTNK
jgi:hypothetical protein